MLEARGPGYVAPPGFVPLVHPFEPAVDDLLYACSDAVLPHDMVRLAEICFAGAGEPLLRLEVLVNATRQLSIQREGVTIKVITNGLVPTSECEATAKRLRDAGIGHATVALMSAHAKQYQQLMRPQAWTTVERLSLSPSGTAEIKRQHEYLGHAEVCGFVRALGLNGIEVECMAVARADVDLDAAASLARSLGANFRACTHHPGQGEEAAAVDGSSGSSTCRPSTCRPSTCGSSLGESAARWLPAERRRKAESITADAAEAAKERGNALLRRGELKAALGCYHDAVATYDALESQDGVGDMYAKAHAICCANRSLVLGKLGRAEEAETEARRAIELDPLYRKAFHRLGSALALQGREEEAAAAFEYAQATPMTFAKPQRAGATPT